MRITEIKLDEVGELRRGTIVEHDASASAKLVAAIEKRAPLGWERLGSALVAEIWDGRAESLLANRHGAVRAVEQFISQPGQ